MGFLDGFFALLTGNNDPDLKKKRALKLIGKEISKNRYHKFYRTISGEVTPVLASFFYDIYKTVSPAQVLLKNAEKSAILKQLTVEAFMSKELQAIYDRLSPEFIETQSKTIGYKELSHQLQEDMDTFSVSFGISEINTIDRCYNHILAFIGFVNFDFVSFLKKLDYRFQERIANYEPQFRYVNGKHVLENIKDFLDILSLEATAEEWKVVFEILKKYKAGVSVMEINQWKKFFLRLQDVQRAGILPLMVRHISQNTDWQKRFQVSDEYIMESFLKAKKAEVQSGIDKITNDKLVTKRDALAKQIFGSADIIRLRYYTNVNNDPYTKRNLDGFTYISPLNYLKAFLVDYPDIREVCDLFLIRGQWASQELSRRISHGLHEISDVSEQLSLFDETLAEQGTAGSKLKNHINKYKTDKGQITHLKVTLSIINNQAEEMIRKAINSFTLVGAYLKDLYDDYKKSHPVLLVNWKELETVSEHTIEKRLETSYRVVEDFIYLMQLFVSEEEDAEEDDDEA